MAETQMIIGVKDGKSYKIVLDAEKMNKLRGKKIGDKISGDVVELPGYEFEIRGGTDSNGFPMRADLPGTLKKRLLLASGVGYKTKGGGVRRRKMIRGNTLDSDIAQLNVSILKEGSKKLDKLLAAPEESSEKAEKAE